MGPKKRSTPFQRKHESEYGLKVVERQANNSRVIAVACQFCTTFGREEKVGSKRSRTANIKYFRAPFRPEHYRKHAETQHPERFNEYREASKEEKAKFFDNFTPASNTLHRHYGGAQLTLKKFIDKPIVDIIVGEMLFDPDEETSTLDRALSVFQDTLDPAENGNGVTSRYCISIKNRVQFGLVVDYLSVGSSFRMASRIVTMTKERTGLASIGSCSEGVVAKYARFVCALTMQQLRDILAKSWTFSVAMDMSTHMSTSYLDIRIRLHWEDDILNFRLLAIPMFERHTGEAMFRVASMAFDVLCSDWRDILIGVSTDGERKMTGKIQGMYARLQCL